MIQFTTEYYKELIVQRNKKATELASQIKQPKIKTYVPQTLKQLLTKASSKEEFIGVLKIFGELPEEKT